MTSSLLMRFGAACGVVLGISLGVPGAVETFTGETTVTSLLVGLGAAFGAPALYAFHLRQSASAGTFGVVALGVNLIGLGLFSGVAFALNLVVFFLDPEVTTELLAGPTKAAILGSSLVFVLGTILFGVSMIRAKVLPRIPAWGYPVTLTLLAVLASLPDTLATSLVHVLAATSLIWLSVSTWVRSTP